MNELKKADEVVRALRDYASDCDSDSEYCFQCTFACVCDKFGGNAPKIIADLIDSLTEQLASVTAERDAAVADIRQACTTCMHSGKPSCPWEGTYHHRGEHGEKIGVCNAWQWRGAGKEQNDG